MAPIDAATHETLIQHVLTAHATGDYSAFSEVVTARFLDQVSLARFTEASTALGADLDRADRRRFLGSFKRDGRSVLLYAVETDSPDHETLIQVGLESGTHGWKIDWMWIE